MKNQTLRVSLALVVAVLFACGGTESSLDERIPAEVPSSGDVDSPGDSAEAPEDGVSAQNHGCPRDPYACVNYCRSSGQGKGKCTGGNRKTCTCTPRDD